MRKQGVPPDDVSRVVHFVHTKKIRPLNDSRGVCIKCEGDRNTKDVRHLNGSASDVRELLDKAVAPEARIGHQAVSFNQVRKSYFLRNGSVSRVAGTDLPLMDTSSGASGRGGGER